MMIPPSIVWAWVAGRGGWGVPIILPVVLVWPVWRRGRGRSLLLGPPAVFRDFCALRGFRLDVSREEKISVRIGVI